MPGKRQHKGCYPIDRIPTVDACPWNVKNRCPLAGHLLLILVGGFEFGGAIELQDGVDTDFPDSLGEGGLLCADDEFALVFVAVEFALDGYMGAFGEAAGENRRVSRRLRIDASRCAISGNGKRVGAAPKTRSCFSGGTGTTGEPEPEGCESKAEAAQTPGAARAPKQCRDERAGRGT